MVSTVAMDNRTERALAVAARYLDVTSLVRVGCAGRQVYDAIAADKEEWSRRLQQDCSVGKRDPSWVAWYQAIGAKPAAEPAKELTEEKALGRPEKAKTLTVSSKQSTGDTTGYLVTESYVSSTTGYVVTESYVDSATISTASSSSSPAPVADERAANNDKTFVPLNTPLSFPPHPMRTYCAACQLEFNWHKGRNSIQTVQLSKFSDASCHWKVLATSVWGTVVTSGGSDAYFVANKPNAQPERLHASSEFQKPQDALVSDKYLTILAGSDQPGKHSQVWVWRAGGLDNGVLHQLSSKGRELLQLDGDWLIVALEGEGSYRVIYLSDIWLQAIGFSGYKCAHIQKKTNETAQVFLANIQSPEQINWRIASISPFGEHNPLASLTTCTLNPRLSEDFAGLSSERLNDDQVLLCARTQTNSIGWACLLKLSAKNIVWMLNIRASRYCVSVHDDWLIFFESSGWSVYQISTGGLISRTRCAEGFRPVNLAVDGMMLMDCLPKGVALAGAVDHCKSRVLCPFGVKGSLEGVSSTGFVLLDKQQTLVHCSFV